MKRALLLVLLLAGCSSPTRLPLGVVVAEVDSLADPNRVRYGTWDGMVYGAENRDWPIRIQLEPDSARVWMAYESLWGLPDSLGWGDIPVTVLSCSGTDPRLILTLDIGGLPGTAELSGLREAESMIGAYRDSQGTGTWVVSRR